MSFILDALKKLERQKQGDDPSQSSDQPVMVGGRRWGEKRVKSAFGWGSVIVAVAALVVAGFALYRSLAPSPTDALSSAEAPPPIESSAPDASATGAESKGMKDPEPENLPVARRESAPPSSPGRDDGKSESEKSPDAEDIDESVSDDVETAPPVRLTGRPKGELTPEEKSEEPGTTSEIPDGLPELVLQGTSVVEGKPIAVVNYQRLFEGDTIEGARVIRITDRFVELEYEGKRFTLKF